MTEPEGIAGCQSPGSYQPSPPMGVPLVVVEHPWEVPIEVEFVSELEAPVALVWDRVVRVSGANDELWPFAKMTRPAFEDRLTAPGPGMLPPFRTWFLLFGFVPIARRSMQLEVLAEGRFVETSTSWLTGTSRHERVATTGAGGSTVLADRLTIESRGQVMDAVMRAGITKTFQRRHRRLRHHFQSRCLGGRLARGR